MATVTGCDIEGAVTRLAGLRTEETADALLPLLHQFTCEWTSTRVGCRRLAMTARAMTVLPEPVPASSTPKEWAVTAVTAASWYGRSSPWKRRSISASDRR